MALDEAEAKTEINERLDREVMGGTGTVPDRLSTDADLQPVIDEIAKEGWVVSEPSRDNFLAKHAYVVRVTRSPEHQALVEGRGEVAVGDNTYEHSHSSQFPISKTFFYGEEKLEITDAVMAKGLICLSANKHRRSANWVRDL